MIHKINLILKNIKEPYESFSVLKYNWGWLGVGSLGRYTLEWCSGITRGPPSSLWCSGIDRQASKWGSLYTMQVSYLISRPRGWCFVVINSQVRLTLKIGVWLQVSPSEFRLSLNTFQVSLEVTESFSNPFYALIQRNQQPKVNIPRKQITPYKF